MMKKTIALTVFALTVFFANGQTAKDNWLVGGSLGFSSSTQKETGSPVSISTNTFQFMPDFGYFFLNNFAAGINLDLTSSHSSTDGFSGTTTLFTAGPLVRYYFYSAANVKLFIHGDAEWGSDKSNSSSGGGTQSSPSNPISIYEGKAGAAIFLNRNIALEFTMGYQSLTEKNINGPDTKITTNAFNLGLGFQIYLGPGKMRTGH